MEKKCFYEIDEKGIALLKIHNPPMNALDENVMREFEESLRELSENSEVKVIILTGEGPTFIVGADVNKIKEINTKEDGESLTQEAQGILNYLEKMRKPVIAAINGLCLGGGTEVALACHIRIAGDQAQMGLPEILLGIMPGFGGTQRSARLLGTSRALELMLTGRFVKMDEAEKIGLVNRVVSNDELMNEVKKLAKDISYKGQLAVSAIIESVTEGMKLSLEEGLKLESKCFGRLAESEDKNEGIAAFFEKRRPSFKGK